MVERNVALLRQVADLVDVEGAWDQREWGFRAYDLAAHRCGTSGCSAGWAMVVVYGDRVFHGSTGPMEQRFYVDGRGPVGLSERPRLDEWEGIQSHAARLLGLTDDEWPVLFATGWLPAVEGRPGDALRALADGASVDAVTFLDAVL